MQALHKCKHPVLPALIGAFLANAAMAGNVTISRIDTQIGAIEEIASGPLEHAPWFVHNIDGLRLADVCGAMFHVEEDMYGEKTLVGPVLPDRSLANLRLVTLDEYGGMAIGHDGKPWDLALSSESNGAYRKGEFHQFAIESNSGVDLSKTRLYVKGEDSVPNLAFFDDGRLLGIYDLREGDERVRFIAPKNGWGEIRHAVSMQVGGGRGRHAVLVTLDAAGQLMLHTPVEKEDGFHRYVTSMQGKPVGTATFTGTKGLFADYHDDAVYRWTDGGDLYRVDLNTGTEHRLGAAGAFRNGFVMKQDDDMHFVSQSGRFADCPAKETVIEAPKGKSALVIAVEELKAIDASFDAALRERIAKGNPPDLWEKNAGELNAILSPWLLDIERFEEAYARPAREKLAAFRKQHGDKATVTAALERETGDPYFLGGALFSLEKNLGEWDAYRRDLAEAIARNGSTYFMLAEAVGKPAEAAAHFSKAKPYGDWALRFDAQNETARRIAEKAEQNAELAKAAEAAAIASATWPEDRGEFEFDKDAMKKKILAYFQEHHDDEDRKRGARYFAIRLSSGWTPGLVNIWGQLLEWRIGGYIAKTIPGDPGHALVIPIQIGTQTNQKNSPFATRYFRSNSYRIPIERVHADDKATLEQSLELIGK